MSASDKEKHKDEKQWYDLPDLIAGPKLFQIRNELREKNLHDTEEPPLESSAAPRDRRGPQRPHERWHLQRPDLSAHGQRRHAVRAQRPAERDVPGHRQPDERRARGASAWSC